MRIMMMMMIATTTAISATTVVVQNSDARQYQGMVLQVCELPIEVEYMCS